LSHQLGAASVDFVHEVEALDGSFKYRSQSQRTCVVNTDVEAPNCPTSPKEAAWIGAAYWFTASTWFANPAITIARALSNTFAGIAPYNAPAFIVSQLCGALLGLMLAKCLQIGSASIPSG
jgi:hypothetical protein